MFRNTHMVAALTLAFGLVTGVSQAQSGGFATPAGYPLPGGFTQPVTYPYAAPAPAVVLQPPVRLGFQWAMCDYGMHVAALREGGLAQQIGLLPGDIIVQMNTFQIVGWNEYCLALQDAVYNRGGQVEMWLYRPTPAGYELQYVAFTIHEEQIIVDVPCGYHEEKCHSQHVSRWVDKLVHLNQRWKEHRHDGHADNHHGLKLNFLGKGVNLNFNQFNKGGNNFGNVFDKHGPKNFGGQFGNFKLPEVKPQIKHFDKGNFDKGNVNNFEKHFNKNFTPQFNSNHGSSFNNSMKNFSRSSGGGNSMKSFSSQMSHSMKSFGGGGHK